MEKKKKKNQKRTNSIEMGKEEDRIDFFSNFPKEEDRWK